MTQRIKETFLSLLRLGLWGEIKGNLEYLPLSNEEWSSIYEISLSQTVEGVVYEGVLMVPKEHLPPYNILLRWTARIDGVERYNIKMRQNLAILGKGFSNNNFSFVLLKGLGLAENYNKPLLRVSGDVDLYFPSEKEFKSANNFLTFKGYNVQKGDHNSVFYKFHQIEIEHHTRMIDVFNPFCQKFIQELIIKERNKSRFLDLGDIKITLPSYILSQVQTSAHILKHYLGFGVGLRQFCDVARLCYVKDENFDGEELRYIYQKIGLDKWMNVVHNFLVNELGLCITKLPYPIEEYYNTNLILQDVLHSGNFGFHDVRYQKVDSVISERYHRRDYVLKRTLPHLIKLIKLSPAEVFWYPINKVYTKIVDR